MTELSFPVVNQSLSEDQWQIIGLAAMSQGIVDRGGNPYNIASRSDVNNTITIGLDSLTGKNEAVVRGFVHRIDTTKVLSVPAVSADTTYEIGLVYTPANHGTTAGPIVLDVWTAPGSTANGVIRIPLYRVLRKSGVALTSTVIEANRQRAVPNMEVSATADLGSADRYVVGTMAFVQATSEWHRVSVSSTGVRSWVKVTANIPAHSIAETADTLVQRTSTGTARVANPVHAQDAVPRQWFLDETALLRTAGGSVVADTLVKRGSDGGFLVPTATHGSHPIGLNQADARYRNESDLIYNSDLAGSIDAHKLNKTGNVVWWEIVSGSTSAYNDTASGTTWATVGVTSGGKFFRYTSARKYKTDLVPLDWTLDECLAPLPHEYTDIQTGQRRIGFPADDYVDTRPGKFLIQWGDPDNDGDDEVEGWHYELTGVMQQRALQLMHEEQQRLDHNQRIIAAKLGLTYGEDGKLIEEAGA